jgi:hypothetical protein
MMFIAVEALARHRTIESGCTVALPAADVLISTVYASIF